MSVAAIYDIHGNLPALNAVLEEIEALGVERIVIGGDVAYGPLVRETLDRLLELGERAVWVRGNTDRELVAFCDGNPTVASLPENYQQAGKWEAQQVTRAHRDFLAALPEHQVLEVDGLGEVLFCHGSPRSDEEIVTGIIPEERLQRILSGVTQPTVVCGHTHIQFDRQSGATRVINAGSVGMSYDGPDAYWALLEPTVELRHTPYDHEQAITLIRASGHPLTEWFLDVLQNPPSAEEATTYFEQMATQKDAESEQS